MDVYSNRFILSDLDFMTATATEREIQRCALRLGDVVITKDSEQYDDIGVPALVRDDVDNLVCGYHLAILRPLRELIDGSYLLYALQIGSVQHQFHAYANGVTRFGLRRGDILRVEIPLPSLPEQRAIANILSALDDKIELNRRMNETLEAMTRALFESWFVDFQPVHAKFEGRNTGLPDHISDLFPDKAIDSEIGKIPEGWEVVLFPDLIEVNPSRPLRKGAVAPYLDMANMTMKGHTPDRVIDRPFGSGMRFANGDTLVARITPCLENGKTAYVDFLEQGQIGWGSTEYIVLRPKPPLPCEFAYCLARSNRFREFAIQNMTGTSGRQRVPAKAFAQFALPSSPDMVGAEFGRLIRPLIARAKEAAAEVHALSALRDALIPGLVSGQMRVRGMRMRGAHLTQAEANALLALEKHRVDAVQWEYPGLGGSIKIPLTSADGCEPFLLDLHRVRIVLTKGTYQTRYRQIVILARLDFGGAPHRNLDGEEIGSPHLHLVSRGIRRQTGGPRSGVSLFGFAGLVADAGRFHAIL